MKCPYCGKEVEEGSKFCDGCGAKLEETKKEEGKHEYVYEQPKKSKGGLIAAIIIISVLLITGIVVGIILLTQGGKSENKSGENKKEGGYIEPKDDKKSNASIDKIKYTDTLLENGDIVLIVKNNNNSEVYVDFTVEYYDEDKIEVDHQYGSLHGLPSGEETALRLFRTARSYDNYKITAKLSDASYYKSSIKDVKTTSKNNADDREIAVTFTNDSKNKLDYVTVAAVFYKNGKIIGYNYDTDYDVDVSKSIALYINYPYDKNYRTIEFDDYKVYVVEASSYSF